MGVPDTHTGKQSLLKALVPEPRRIIGALLCLIIFGQTLAATAGLAGALAEAELNSALAVICQSGAQGESGQQDPALPHHEQGTVCCLAACWSKADAPPTNAVWSVHGDAADLSARRITYYVFQPGFAPGQRYSCSQPRAPPAFI